MSIKRQNEFAARKQKCETRLGTKYEDTSLKLLALGFVVYELFWVLCSKCVCTLQS